MSDALPDSGFADPAGARALACRMRLRTALRKVERSAAALRKLLDKASQVDAGAVATCQCQSLNLTEGDVAGVVELPGDIAADGKDMREDELLEGVELVLQLLDRLGVGLEHGLFSLDHAEKGMSAAQGGHRLSGDAS